METKNISKVMREAAETLRHSANSLDQKANELDETGDLSICGDAMNSMVSMIGSLRLDLLVTRPIRAMRHALSDASKSEKD